MFEKKHPPRDIWKNSWGRLTIQPKACAAIAHEKHNPLRWFSRLAQGPF